MIWATYHASPSLPLPLTFLKHTHSPLSLFTTLHVKENLAKCLRSVCRPVTLVTRQRFGAHGHLSLVYSINHKEE